MAAVAGRMLVTVREARTNQSRPINKPRYLCLERQHPVAPRCWPNPNFHTAGCETQLFSKQRLEQPWRSLQSNFCLPHHYPDWLHFISNIHTPGNLLSTITVPHLLQHLLARIGCDICIRCSSLALSHHSINRHREQVQRYSWGVNQAREHDIVIRLAKLCVREPSDILLDQCVVRGDQEVELC